VTSRRKIAKSRRGIHLPPAARPLRVAGRVERIAAKVAKLDGPAATGAAKMLAEAHRLMLLAARKLDAVPARATKTAAAQGSRP
jgi:hypothetical protein